MEKQDLAVSVPLIEIGPVFKNYDINKLLVTAGEYHSLFAKFMIIRLGQTSG